MSIKYGQTGENVSEVYYGDASIDEVYYGDTLVFSSGLPVWKFNGQSTSSLFLVGDYSTAGFVCLPRNPNDPSSGPAVPIATITGTLGAPGSTILLDGYEYMDYSVYSKTTVLNNKIIYEYYMDHGLMPLGVIALEGSVVGSFACVPWRDYAHPTKVTSNSMVWSGVTYTLDPTYSAKWTTNGIS